MDNNRSWMYPRTGSRGLLNHAFVVGLEEFMNHAISQPSSLNGTNIQCPCTKCEFKRVMDTAGPNFDPQSEEIPNAEAQKLYDILHSSEKDLYGGCETSQLSAKARMLSLKSDHHWPEACYDQTSEFIKSILPEDNTFIDGFYNTKKHMEGLGLPSVKIDCCVNGCMIYWGEDTNLDSWQAHGCVKTRYLDDCEYIAINNYVLFNCPEVAPYIEIFIDGLREQNPYINGAEIDKCLESNFATWFRHYAQDASLVPNEFVQDLASGPLRSVRSVPIYYVNGYKFHTRTYRATKSTFNSGVCIKGSNYSESSNDYFGILDEILIIEYPRFPIKRTSLFKCEWFDPTLNTGTRVHQRYNIVEVHRRKRLSVYEPFVLAMQATQVYFCNYPSLRRDKVDWLVVSKIKAHALVDLPQIPQSHREAFQDDVHEHLNMIDTEDILTRLNDVEGTSVDLDDDEGSSEEETQNDTEDEESPKTDNSDDESDGK
ncbi:DUF4216 domain-containing protein [Heracleum sosnowskyi]|uniref:DUF4216 domain-containing protein n=1 Tax=Heracleum sosnowskyi TaxID=360622 RepID=A0AAD8IY60_9APIA|nr:DUF4216 domain-containing protein [Heracleum sosnowskyi]